LLTALIVSTLLLGLVGLAHAIETTITSGPEDGEVITIDSATFTFTSDDPEATFGCNIDGEGFRSCTSPVVMSDLRNGRHSFIVRAIGGNPNDATQDSRRFTVEVGNPPIGPSAECVAARRSATGAKARLKKASAKKATTVAAKKAKRKAVARARAALRRADAGVKAAC
jgi:hypothetical protein